MQLPLQSPPPIGPPLSVPLPHPPTTTTINHKNEIHFPSSAACGPSTRSGTPSWMSPRAAPCWRRSRRARPSSRCTTARCTCGPAALLLRAGSASCFSKLRLQAASASCFCELHAGAYLGSGEPCCQACLAGEPCLIAAAVWRRGWRRPSLGHPRSYLRVPHAEQRRALFSEGIEQTLTFHVVLLRQLPFVACSVSF